MQQLMRWEPFKDTDDFFRSFMSPAWGRWPGPSGENAGRTDWLPAVDIRETDKEYLVIAELPGLRREDVKVRLEGDVLTVEGERRHEKETKGERTHRIERAYGSFQRRFSLPDDADPGDVRAEAKDGVLTVHVPKREIEKAKAREIAVQ